MKRISGIAAAAAMIIGANAFAQNSSDALRYSKNDYLGTARSMAMGNAFTALGGDLGSITINPAGSAVNSYSQITLTPGVSLTTTKATYNPFPAGADALGRETQNNKTRFQVPNVGANFNFKTGRNTGLKSWSIGITANSTAEYYNSMAASGMNNGRTSLASALATNAYGYSSSMLNDNNYYDAPWDLIVAYKSGLIANYGEGDKDYIGITEKLYATDEGDVIGIAGPLTQRYGRDVAGEKYDVAFNIGFNVSDILYLGANLGLSSMSYDIMTYFKEIAEDPNDFELDYGNGNITYFNDLRYKQSYSAEGVGFYGKFGFILTPVGGLRIGGAIQTPTVYTIRETWSYSAATTCSGHGNNGSAISPTGDYEYKLISPFRFNLGVAYTLGKVGVLSVDYEHVNYSSMKFREKGTNDHSGFAPANQEIKDFTGSSHMLRVGAEFKVTPSFALRAGYNLATSPERYYDEFDKKQTPKATEHAVGFGLGYSSKGSFFFDLGCLGRFYPKEYVYPYADYLENNSSPEIVSKNRLWNIVATFGFRF